MRITKYEHAFFVVSDEQGNKIAVDPGVFSKLPDSLNGIVAVVITHEHPDHINSNHITKIIKQNPDVIIYGPESINKLIDHPVTTPSLNTDYTVSTFNLSFYGKNHEMIRPKLAIVDNLGVIINNKIAYPGDSFTTSGIKPAVLFLPIAAPWLKVNNAISLLKQESPNTVIPTHDAILSDSGKDIYDGHFADEAKYINSDYRRLSTGESIDIS